VEPDVLLRRRTLLSHVPQSGSVKSQVDDASNRLQSVSSRHCDPGDVVEAQLLGIWSAICPGRRVTVVDDFFGIDGASRNLDWLLSTVEDVYGRKFSLDMFLTDPTIRGMARVIRQQNASQFSSTLEAIQTTGDAPPIFAIPPDASPRQVFAELARQFGPGQPFYGLKPLPPDSNDIQSGWIKTTAAHYIDAIMRIQPSGPYRLVGRCWGGFAAFEVAQQLHDRGEAVDLLALLDCGPPLTRSIGFYCHAMTFKAGMAWRNLGRHWRGQRPIEYALIPNHPIHFDLVYAHQRPTARYDQLVWDANLRGASEYVCRPYSGRITLVHSEEFVQIGRTGGEGWRRLCGSNLVEHVIPGRHVDTLHKPSAAKLATVLRGVIAQSTDS
jgi:thioesterase domain-containing protein